MSEESKRPHVKKLLSFFLEAPKQTLLRTRTMGVSFAQHAVKPISQVEKLKLFFTRSATIVVQKTSESMENLVINIKKAQNEENLPNTSKVSSIGKFASFFKRASIQIEERTNSRMDGLKRSITAQSKIDNNCNSSLAISQLDDQLIDRNAASFANMTLELSMNTNVLHHMALPSKDTNYSHRELMFDVTSNPILERSESQEIHNQILCQDQIIQDSNSKQDDSIQKIEIERQQEEQENDLENQQYKPPHTHAVKLMSFLFKAPENIKRKSTLTFSKIKEGLQGKKSDSKEKLQKGVGKVMAVVAINSAPKKRLQQEKLATFFQTGPSLVKKKTKDFFSRLQSKLTLQSMEPSQQNEDSQVPDREEIQLVEIKRENPSNIGLESSQQNKQNIIEGGEMEEWLEVENKKQMNPEKQDHDFSGIDDKDSNIEWEPMQSENRYPEIEDNGSRGTYTNQDDKIQQEITHIQKKSNHQDSSYSDAGQMFEIINQQQKNQDVGNMSQQSKIYVQENLSGQMTSKIFNKEEIRQQYEEINQEIQQLKYEKLHLLPQKNVIIKSPFRPNYKKLAEISDDNEALYKAKDLIRKMNLKRREKEQREKQQYDKIDEYFHNLQYLKQNQDDVKNRYENQRKQQIQGRIDDYHKKQREFAQLQQISHNFVRKLVNVGPQQGKLSQEMEESVIQIKGGYRKVKLKNLGIIELPRINQNDPQFRRYVNVELVKSKQEDMIRKYEASKLAILKSSD